MTSCAFGPTHETTDGIPLPSNTNPIEDADERMISAVVLAILDLADAIRNS